MSEYLSDDEEKEKIREWWNENGKFIVTGVGIGLIGIFVWRFWNTHLDNKAGAASLIYEDMALAIAEGETDKVTGFVDTLKDQYKGTAYVAQAYLLLAKTSVDSSNFSDAATQLQQAIKTSKDAELVELANFRLAKVRLAMQEYDAALKELKSVKGKSYLPLVEEMRGDIYRAQGDMDKAREAYAAAKTAMQETPVGDPNLLQMKLSDLGATE